MDTIGDYIEKFYLNRTFDKKFDFSSYEITKYVTEGLKYKTGKQVTEQSVLREMRDLKFSNKLDYGWDGCYMYTIIPKRLTV